MNALLPVETTARPHPARYTEALLPTMARMLRGCNRILDPMAGIGGAKKLAAWLPGLDVHMNELEPEWAAQAGARCGDARSLPWPDGYFDGVCVSPPYGNRMADGFLPSDSDGRYTRHNYASYLRRQLSEGSAAGLTWGPGYRDLMAAIWQECTRVLRPGGRFVLNVKDHVRAGKVQPVTAWHAETLVCMGYMLAERVEVPCPGMRNGQNREARVDVESVLLFVLGGDAGR